MTPTRSLSPSPSIPTRSRRDAERRQTQPTRSRTATAARTAPSRSVAGKGTGSLRSAHPQGHPGWVGALQWWQRTSTILAFLSCSTVLGIYSWTVYTQERWNRQYEALQQMRRHERQFLLTQESIANSLRDTAARSDMVPLVPERMIEVPIASPREDPDPDPQFQARTPEKQEHFFPVGY